MNSRYDILRHLLLLLGICISLSLFPACTTTEDPETVPEETVELIPEIVEESIPTEELQAEQTEEETFTVSQEVYNQTFNEVEALIHQLNRIISSNNYDQWLTFLTDEYIDYFGSDAVLKEYSALIKKRGYNINLLSLKDYFRYIVVGSRADVTLDNIEFIDESHVTAVSIIDDQAYILYYLERIDDTWKIGFWD